MPRDQWRPSRNKATVDKSAQKDRAELVEKGPEIAAKEVADQKRYEESRQDVVAFILQKMKVIDAPSGSKTVELDTSDKALSDMVKEKCTFLVKEYGVTGAVSSVLWNLKFKNTKRGDTITLTPAAVLEGCNGTEGIELNCPQSIVDAADFNDKQPKRGRY